MNKQSKGILAASVAASLGGIGAADAAVYTAVLKTIVSYSNNGTSGGNITSSTATWSYNDVTNVLSQTGGTFNVRFTTSPTSTLFRHSITGLLIGNGAPAAADAYVCVEGNFGGNVGASLCGNYNFGGNFNESSTSWGPGTAFARTVGGDDMTLGTQQNLAAYDTFNLVSLDTNPPGSLVLTNASCTSDCTTIASGFNAGYRWTLDNLVLVQQGAIDDAAQAESGVATVINVLANDVGYADPVTVTITAQGANGTAVVNGSPGNQAAVNITYTSTTPNFTGTDTFTYQATDGVLTDTGVVTVTVVDSVPAAFTFASQAGVALSTPVISAATTISGISIAVPVSVTGGDYSIGCTGTFTNVAATITNGQDVCVRHTSAALPLTDTVTTLTVGGVNGTFTSTTVAVDTVPDAFSFPALTDQATSAVIVSSAATIGGINAPAAISVTGGEYSINGGAYTAAAGTITDGQQVTVRQTSSATPSTATNATLTIGGVAATFTVTTAATIPDTTPDQFNFVDQDGVDRDIEIVSAPVTITGINAASPIIVSGGEYSIGCNGTFTSAPGTITNGQTVCVRHQSASTAQTAVNTTLSVGPANPPPPGAATRVTDVFSSGTRPSSGGSSAVDGFVLGLLGLLGLAGRGRRPRR